MNIFFANIFKALKYLPIIAWQTVTLAAFLIIFILIKLGAIIFCKVPFVCGLSKRIEIAVIYSLKRLSRKVIGGKTDSIDQIDLIELSLGNMRMRKARTLITIGGMTVGISIIVLLVSLGYGLQELVITRVAKLEQMRQADVSLQIGSKLKINDQTQESFAQLSGVTSVSPVVSVVGKINFNNSVSDMVAYGVTSDYLKNSDIKVTSGRLYDNNKTSKDVNISDDITSAEDIERNGEVSFSIDEGTWLKVRENSDRSAKVLGYTKKDSEIQIGKEVDGGEYVDSDGKIQSKWITTELLIWKKGDCGNDLDCDSDGYVPMTSGAGEQVKIAGYIAKVEMRILNKFDIHQQHIESFNKNIFDQGESHEAVVNQSMLSVLGISENDAIGKKFETSFVVVGNLMGEGIEKMESPKVKYEIVGVVNEGIVPIFYVPFVNLRSLGIVNYSQLKVSANSQENLPIIRRQIEAMGYATYSVSDTVDQINSFFDTARLILGLIGMVALFVASLGMFNTLTVSLLERTREVGLLKAMGMRSTEVRNLFLTESIIMGFLGGMLGVFLGFLLGKGISAIVSVFSIAQGLGAINITHIPWSLAILIASISLFVGIFTGIYPAMRAQKISALNALRYE